MKRKKRESARRVLAPVNSHWHGKAIKLGILFVISVLVTSLHMGIEVRGLAPYDTPLNKCTHK